MTGKAGTGRDEEPVGPSLHVEPTPLRGSGGGPRRAVVALAAIAVVVAGAIGVAARPADRRPPVAVVAASPSATASPSPSFPRAAAILDATPARVPPATLAAAVRDGSLDGRLVFVDGRLSATSVGCRSLATVRAGCVNLAIPGVGVPVRAADPSMVWRRAPPLGAWLVTVARAGTLVYLGSLVPDHDVAANLPELERRLADVAPDADGGSLYQANGTLVTNIPSPCNNLCPPPPPYLADQRNWDNPALPETGTVVDVARDAPEIPQDTERFDGTFLLARGGDAGWRVVARYVQSHALRVQVP